VLEADAAVRAVAEGLVLRVAAAAQRDHGATAQSERFSLLIHELEITLQPEGTIADDSNFHGSHGRDDSTAKRAPIMGAMLEALAAALLWISVQGAPTQAGEQEGLLERIRARMRETLERMPDYTCVETIERWRQGYPCPQCRWWERLRLEVAVIGGKERFAWPGAAEFESRDIAQIVPPGPIGTGDFWGFATAIFARNAASYQGPFEDRLDGRATWRYDYRVPRELSGYEVRDGRNSARVAYHGSFWVDRDSLELLRLDVEAEGLPAPPLEITAVRTAIRYERASIGGRVVLLPAASELTMGTGEGRSSQNRISFTGCRQYAAQSQVRFEEEQPAPAPEQERKVRRRLPPGLNLELSLATPLEPASAAAGDLLEAVLVRDVRVHGELLAARGARVTGRLRAVRQHLAPRAFGMVALEFNRLEAPGVEAEFRARLELLGGIVAGARRAGDVMPVGSDEESAIYFNGPLLRLSRGFRMLWRTLP